jgi:hypothetical protein
MCCERPCPGMSTAITRYPKNDDIGSTTASRTQPHLLHIYLRYVVQERKMTWHCPSNHEDKAPCAMRCYCPTAAQREQTPSRKPTIQLRHLTMTPPFDFGGNFQIAIQDVWTEVRNKVERCRSRRVKGADARHNLLPACLRCLPFFYTR